MCESCTKHGEGKKWYLQAKNYSDDLLADTMRRSVITNFYTAPGGIVPADSPLGKLNVFVQTVPDFVRDTLNPYRRDVWLKMYRHQVLPIEDIEQIFTFLGSVVRLPCLCRQLRHAKEQRYCYGLSLKPEGGEFFKIIESIDKSFVYGPEASGMERMSKEEALNHFREYEYEGAFHAAYIFVEPYIAGICNCDRAECGPMQTSLRSPTPTMARGEYVAKINMELCNGCRSCMMVCQFGALGFSVANKKISIDQRNCYGCGICRVNCAQKAISLVERSSVPAIANLW